MTYSHVKTPLGLVRHHWQGQPPTDAVFTNYGPLLDPNQPHLAQMVHIWRSPSKGYGFEPANTGNLQNDRA